MTQHRDGTFTGSAGEAIWWQAWLPEEPGAVVVLAHGLHEHCGRYAHVAERLNAAGYAVHALDHRGHGRSGGPRGNVGSMAGVLEDFDRLRVAAEEAHPGLPVFVLGHSMGGLIATEYVIHYGETGLAGLAVSGPAIDVSSAGRAQQALAPLLGRLAPNLGVMSLPADKVSRDPAVVRDYEQDPLNHHGKVVARTGAEILEAAQDAVRRMPGLTLPVLAMHGGADALVPVAASRAVHDTVSSTDRTLEVYDELFHEIFNEPERDAVLGDLVAWLDRHR